MYCDRCLQFSVNSGSHSITCTYNITDLSRLLIGYFYYELSNATKECTLWHNIILNTCIIFFSQEILYRAISLCTMMSSILRFVRFVSGPSLMEQYLWFTSFLANYSISWVTVIDVSLSCFTVNLFLSTFKTSSLSTCALPKTALKITWQAFICT